LYNSCCACAYFFHWIILNGEHRGAAEAGDITAVLDGVAAPEPQSPVLPPILARPQEEQLALQLRQAVLPRPRPPILFVFIFYKIRKAPMTVVNPREVPEYELNPLELQVRKSDGITKSADIFLPFSQRGSYQVAKWNGTKVSVKILDKDCYTDPESMYVLSSPENHLGDVVLPLISKVVQFM
ncbi:uncharacterized protein LOC126621563, partial [Malus sylvestris]|uniref:uncharacterized protein LOC126621563 n=1 Tax=Malus sylvestris TaxID=3752 RepID=UPI0021AD336E